MPFVFLAAGLGAVLLYFFVNRQTTGAWNEKSSGQAFMESEAQRGAISVGGSNYSGGAPRGGNYVQTGLGLASQGLQTAVSAAPESAFATSAAVPIIGLGIAGAAAVFGTIAAKHKAAVETEAKTLNAAYPRFQTGMLQVVQALLARTITPAQARSLLDQMVSLYYTQVQPIIKGKWAYSGLGDVSKPPSVCNGPCTVGHWFVEGYATFIKIMADNIYNGTPSAESTRSELMGDRWLKLGAVPPNAGFSGAGEVIIKW